MRFVYFSTVFAGILALDIHSAAALAQPNPGELEAVPVSYKTKIAVVGTRDGAAVIAFSPTKPGNKVKYRFRYLSRNAEMELAGEGEVFEKYKKRTFLIFTFASDDGSKLRINAGPIELGWSAASEGAGYLYHRPKAMRVTLGEAKDFRTVELSQYFLRTGK